MNNKQKFFHWLNLSIVLLISLVGCSDTSTESNTTSMEFITPTTITEKTDNGIVNTDEDSGFQRMDKEDTISTDVSNLEVHFIDVGQGDCTLIVCGGQSLLIDAGNNNKGTAVQMYLQKHGIETLDYAIGTHPDADHIGGLDVILYKFDCKTIILPDYQKDTRTYDDVIQTMKNKNYKNTIPIVGTEYTMGDATFTIIAPNGSYGSNANDYSVGIVLQHGSNKFVFTGDAEEGSEADILNNGIDISTNVYKVSHHGSKTASTQEFLDAMNPEYAVISCGEGNSYGHPHAQTLNRLRSMGVKVFRTDEQGSVIATSDGKEITWNCSPSETWQAGEGNKSDKEDDASVIDTDRKIVISEEATYIINTNTGKFHNPTCYSVKDIANKNRLDSMQSRDEIINQGYSPCGRCKP